MLNDGVIIHFWIPTKKNIPKVKKYIYSKENKKIIAVRIGC
jgi:hypothetical protein